LQKRVADDIARRLQVMSQNWTNGKLSPGVKSRMIKLAKGKIQHLCPFTYSSILLSYNIDIIR